jgi:two-component system, OmpR family, response regulator RstA
MTKHLSVPENSIATQLTHEVQRVCHIGSPTAQWTEIRRGVERRHLAASDARNVDELLDSFSLESIDLIVVSAADDSEPPHEICGEIRHRGYMKPIIVITDAGDSIDPILGLESGADAWISSDTDARMAIAQIRALLRQTQRLSVPVCSSTDPVGTLTVGNFLLCARSHELLIDEQQFYLSGAEFELLWILAENAGEVVSREDIVEILDRSQAPPKSRIINTSIARLRKRLGAPHASRIKTIRSAGYMLSVAPYINMRPTPHD